MNKKKKQLYGMDLVIALCLTFLDQLTKHLAMIHLKDQPAIPLIKGVLELQYLENRGAAFGILQNQKVILLIVSVLFIGVILFFLNKVPDTSRYTILHVLAAAVIAGGVGNMIDRFRQGYVVDFIYFSLIDFPIFNVADIYVVTATILVFVLLLFVYKDEELKFIK